MNKSCTWNLLSTFLSADFFSRCSLVILYFYGPAVFTVVPVWQCCQYHSFSTYVKNWSRLRMLNSNFFITDHRIVITGKKTVTVSVYAVANYDVVIIKWCLKPGVASFILRHIVLYVVAAIKECRRHRCRGHLRWQLPLTAAAGAVADIKRAGLQVQRPVLDSGWDVGLKLRPCSAPVGRWLLTTDSFTDISRLQRLWCTLLIIICFLCTLVSRPTARCRKSQSDFRVSVTVNWNRSRVM